LTRPAPALDEPRLRRLLSRSPFVRQVDILESTESTNDDARRLSREGAPSGTVVVANHQRSGRGRLGRDWHSAAGLGLYVSVLLRPSRPLKSPTRWTLASALAACEACEALGCPDVVIKWPNDLYHGGRKFAGTLTESRSLGGTVEEVIVGTGFNVNHTRGDLPGVLAVQATSLALASAGRVCDRELLASSYVDRLGAQARRLDEGNWNEVAAEWLLRAPGARGGRVSVQPAPGDGSPAYAGITRGIDECGALRVERPDGTIVSIHSNESIVPVEG
jgi:BirA family biotin operon repressor/biotin-[acetyl-CoA-carboxylase] ligase